MKGLKQISLKIQQKHLLDFKIKLRHDGLTHGDFLLETIMMYISSDPSFAHCRTDIIEKRSKFSAARKRESLRIRKRSDENVAEVTMTKEDRENIYSLLEQEVGEL